MQQFAEVADYLLSLPNDRRLTLEKLRKLILLNLPKGYEEGIQYGMISYYVPLTDFADTYNGQPLGYIAIASQKNYLSLYLMSVYGGNETAFREAYKKSGKKLNMGKSCVRFKSFEDLPVDLIAKTVRSLSPSQFVRLYKNSRN